MDKSPKNKEIIDRYLMGIADEAEVEQLDALLRSDEALRQTFLSTSRIDSHLRELAIEHSAPNPQESSPPRRHRSLWINPGTAAALLIGLFSASVVWAVIPQRGEITRTSQTIVTEDFEDPEMKVMPHLPIKANQWFGRLDSVSPEGAVSPVHGSRVGQLHPNSGNRSESVRYVVDLKDFPELAQGHIQSLEVKASLSASLTEQEPGFHVELVALKEAPEDVRTVWKDRESFGEKILQQVKRNYRPESGEYTDWQEISASLDIPEGSRSIIISLGVFRLEPDRPIPDIYLDAIEVRLVDTYEPST